LEFDKNKISDNQSSIFPLNEVEMKNIKPEIEDEDFEYFDGIINSIAAEEFKRVQASSFDFLFQFINENKSETKNILRLFCKYLFIEDVKISKHDKGKRNSFNSQIFATESFVEFFQNFHLNLTLLENFFPFYLKI
jgi:hypothetical protein